MAVSTHSPRPALPPLATQAETAAWLGLDRSRLSQIRSRDTSFPQPLTMRAAQDALGKAPRGSVWSRDDILHWAQHATPPRYPDDRPFPFRNNTLAVHPEKPWTAVTSGTVTLAGTLYGWRVFDGGRQSLLLHAYTGDSGDAVSSAHGADEHVRLVSTAAISELLAVVTVPLPEFLTVLISTSDGDSGSAIVLTVSPTDTALDVTAYPWSVGHTVSPADAARLTGPLPWFTGRTHDALPMWSPHAPVPIATFDADALFVHQAAWWLDQIRSDNAHAAAVRVMAQAAAHVVQQRYPTTSVPDGWGAVADATLPCEQWPAPDSGAVSAAATALQQADPDESGVKPFLLAYVATVADSQFVRIPLASMPPLFAAAARDTGEEGTVRLLDHTDQPGRALVVALTDVGQGGAPPVAAQAPVPAVLRQRAGTASVCLHVDNSLSVAAVTF